MRMLRVFFPNNLLLFIASYLLGVMIALSIYNIQENIFNRLSDTIWNAVDHDKAYKDWLRKHSLQSVTAHGRKRHKHSEIVEESRYLVKNVPLLCNVLITEYNTNISTENVLEETWGKRCLKTVYYNTQSTSAISSERQVHLNDTNHADNWAALRQAIIFMHTNYTDSFDWFYICLDSTYVIIENLLYYISVKNPNDVHYLGHAMQALFYDYNALGPGVVLSKGVLTELHKAFSKGECPSSSASGETALGSCLSQLGIGVIDTQDHLARGRFLMFQPDPLLTPGYLQFAKLFWDRTKFLSSEGPGCCSEYAVSFHNVPINMLYVLDFFIYRLKPHYEITNITQTVAAEMPNFSVHRKESAIKTRSLPQS